MGSDEPRVLGRQLAAARRGGGSVPAFAAEGDAAAYAVQAAAIAELGRPLGGWKIGATAPATQAALGTDQPFYGPMPSADCHASGAVLPWTPGVRGVECEIAFHLAGPLPRRPEAYPEGDVARAVGAAHLAIEVVATRLESGTKLDARQAIADFGLNAAFVRGPEIPGWAHFDLAAVGARCLVNGEVRGEGTAAVVLGGPLKALTWLANAGPGLAAGHWVSTGTLTGLLPVRPGDRVTGDFGALGKVQVAFSE